jgi:hypothetical protein
VQLLWVQLSGFSEDITQYNFIYELNGTTSKTSVGWTVGGGGRPPLPMKRVAKRPVFLLMLRCAG